MWLVFVLQFLQMDMSEIFHYHLSLNYEGSWGTTDDFATIFFCSPLPSGTCRTPGLSGLMHGLMLSSHLFFCPPCLLPPFHCALQNGFGQTWWAGDMTIPLQFASLYDGQEVFVWSDCLLGLGTDFNSGNSRVLVTGRSLFRLPLSGTTVLLTPDTAVLFQFKAPLNFFSWVLPSLSYLNHFKHIGGCTCIFSLHRLLTFVLVTGQRKREWVGVGGGVGWG